MEDAFIGCQGVGGCSKRSGDGEVRKRTRRGRKRVGVGCIEDKRLWLSDEINGKISYLLIMI